MKWDTFCSKQGWGVVLPKWDILFWVGPQKSDIIGYGWVGRSKKGPKNRISFMDGPLMKMEILKFEISAHSHRPFMGFIKGAIHKGYPIFWALF